MVPGMSLDPDRIIAHTDDVLVAITDGRPVTRDMLWRLPPWRAVLLARVAAKAGVMQPNEVIQLVEEARAVGGAGQLARRCARCGAELRGDGSWDDAGAQPAGCDHEAVSAA